MHDRKQLMQLIQQYDFLLYDLQLYLDTHPRCPKGLKMWRDYQAMRQKAVDTYVQQCGPIQPNQTDGNDPWSWIEGPWPWEKEAN